MKKPKPNTSKKRTSLKWCICGFKRHGRKHVEGEHHNKEKK